MAKITPDDFTRIDNDSNGNPRHVIHFLQLHAGSYEAALAIGHKLGGRKYHNKRYGGGIAFQCYNLTDLCDRLNDAAGLEDDKPSSEIAMFYAGTVADNRGTTDYNIMIGYSEGKAFYNLGLKGNTAYQGGYYDYEYIFKLKNVDAGAAFAAIVNYVLLSKVK